MSRLTGVPTTTALMLLMLLTPGIASAGQAAGAAPQARAAARTAPAAPRGYRYEAGGRRDPFVSLLKGGADGQRLTLGARPQGLPGLAVSEVVLKGTLASPTGFVGLLQGVDNRTYIVRPGDQLLDGRIQAITATTMVILQRVEDSLAKTKEREVRKSLRQADEVR